MDTQNKLVLLYMQQHGSITPKDAVFALGCYRLSARIHDLREMGYKIKTESRRFVTSTGRSGSFAEYSLVNEE